jgi:hypothetical protein
LRATTDWRLPDPVLVEVHLRLRHELAESPNSVLVRMKVPFDGMGYGFSMIDPENRLCQHLFLFQVFYGQDEESLHVVRAGYRKRVGL